MSVQIQISEMCRQYAKEQQGCQELDYTALANLIRDISELNSETKMQTVIDQIIALEKTHKAEMAKIEATHQASSDSLKDSINSLKWVLGAGIALIGIGLTILGLLIAKSQQPTQAQQPPVQQPPVVIHQYQPQQALPPVQPVQPQQTVEPVEQNSGAVSP